MRNTLRDDEEKEQNSITVMAMVKEGGVVWLGIPRFYGQHQSYTGEEEPQDSLTF